MKTLFTIILATVAFVSAPAQNRIIKQNRQVASFSAINASGGWDVIVRQGDRQSVSIEVKRRGIGQGRRGSQKRHAAYL